MNHQLHDFTNHHVKFLFLVVVWWLYRSIGGSNMPQSQSCFWVGPLFWLVRSQCLLAKPIQTIPECFNADFPAIMLTKPEFRWWNLNVQDIVRVMWRIHLGGRSPVWDDLFMVVADVNWYPSLRMVVLPRWPWEKLWWWGKWVESGTGHPFLVHQNGSSKSVPMEMCVAIIGISPRSAMWHEIKMPKPAVSTVNQIDMHDAAAKRQTYSFTSKHSLDGILYIKGRIMWDRRIDNIYIYYI